ncbi:hypothetical protein B7463_g9969, partial [Scytalidium lignicola]
MAAKQFQKPPQAPPSFTATPSSLIDDAKAICDQTRTLLDKIAAEVTPETATFENVLLPIAEDEDRSCLQTRIIGFYQAVSTDQKLRDASSKAEEIMDGFSIEAQMREDIFKLVDAAYQKKLDLDPESQRLLEKERKSYIRNGLGLPAGPQRDRFKEIKKRLSQIQIEFQKNLNEENGGIWFTLEELDGVPQDVIDGLETGTGENEGKYRLTFKYPDLFPLLKFAKNAEVRKKVCIDNENKCNQNVPLFKEAIVLRDEAARLLGYPNHASFRIEDKMAKTPKTVNDFLGDLRVQLAPGGETEMAHLLDIKKEDLKNRGLETTDDGNYYLWDTRYYNRMMIEKEHSIDEQKIAEYFPLQSTIESMLGIFEELFGFVFVEVVGEDRAKIAETGKGADIAWHEDVKVFSVWDDEGEGSGFVGYLYLDLHPRPGKYGHAANFSLQPGFLYPNVTRRYPATALVCNFSKPTDRKPSLLKHDEVVTLFHELGHGIHDLAGRTKYSRFHGTSVVRDFVEAPSQMLENWCWTPSQLKALSSHYLTGEKIPDDLIEKQISVKHVNDALFNLRQLHFGIFDMTIHTPKSHDEAENFKLSELYNDLRTQISGIRGPEALGLPSNWGNGQATFGHLIGGYDAGYYGYLSSQVYSTDMFYSVFKKDPMNAKEGRRYRHMVLEKGGSQDEMKTLEDFLGRSPSTQAFYEDLVSGFKAFYGEIIMAGPVTKPNPTHAKSSSLSSTKSKDGKDIPKKSILKRTESNGSATQKGIVGSIPQSSESPLDPLNWPKWKKDLAFFSLCLSAAVVAILKNIFITSNAVIATQCDVTYMAAVALTGLPLIISACIGILYTMIAETCGKRAIYLVSSILMLGGAVWNMHAMQNYTMFMISRVIQGLGWAAFDFLLPMSVKDMFLAHQRTARNQIYNVTVLLFSWGSPVLVGYISQSTNGIHNAIMITNIIQTISVLLLVFVTPETSFDRSLAQNLADGQKPGLSTTISASAPPSSKFRSYLHNLHPMPYRKRFNTAITLAPIRSIAAPSVLLAFLLTGSLLATAQGLAFSISLIFSNSPIFLFPERIGYLFILPVSLSLLSYASSCLLSRMRNRSSATTPIIPARTLVGTAPGIVIGVAGLLSFGIYTAMNLSSFEYTISLKVVSLLLGIMTSGATVLSFYSTKYLDVVSTKYSSPSSSPDPVLTTSHATLQTLLSGIFIIAFPMWISPKSEMATGLKTTVIALTVSQIVVASSILALLWVKGEKVRKFDERVLNWRKEESQRIEGDWELVRWKTSNSFMKV